MPSTTPTWKCALINNKTRGRIAFYANSAQKVVLDAQNYLVANKYKDNEYRMTDPVEVFKTGIDWNTAL